MSWVLVIGAAWLTVAVLVGVLIGRGIRGADRRELEAASPEVASPNFVVDPAIDVVPATAEAAPESAATGISAEPVTPERARHPIPSARPPAVRRPIRTSERTPSPR